MQDKKLIRLRDPIRKALEKVWGESVKQFVWKLAETDKWLNELVEWFVQKCPATDWPIRAHEIVEM